jgi:mannonate dehydratase
MESLGIGTICFNFMAHIGWLRTRSDFPERGGAHVTAFDMKDFRDTGAHITENELWNNYEYFIKAVIPEAEKHGIKLALHPDDPPVPNLGGVSRIMISRDAIRRAIYEVCPSESLGITMCQANYFIMGEDLKDVIREFRDKIMFVHFRNTRGVPTSFRETFHDNGDIDMADIMRFYIENGIDVPVRVDHVPTMAGEVSTLPGYDALGRMFAIGYLKGILDSFDKK